MLIAAAEKNDLAKVERINAAWVKYVERNQDKYIKAIETNAEEEAATPDE
jgi:hypothetical protein